MVLGHRVQSALTADENFLCPLARVGFLWEPSLQPWRVWSRRNRKLKISRGPLKMVACRATPISTSLFQDPCILTGNTALYRGLWFDVCIVFWKMLPTLPLKWCLWKCVPAFCDDSCFTMVQYVQYSLCIPWAYPTTSSLGGKSPSQMLCRLGFNVYGSLHSPLRLCRREMLFHTQNIPIKANCWPFQDRVA